MNPSKASVQPPPNLLAGASVLGCAIVAAIMILKLPAQAAPWSQVYDPTGHWWLSTLIAALPVAVLLGSLAVFHVKAHLAALMGLATAAVGMIPSTATIGIAAPLLIIALAMP